MRGLKFIFTDLLTSNIILYKKYIQTHNLKCVLLYQHSSLLIENNRKKNKLFLKSAIFHLNVFGHYSLMIVKYTYRLLLMYWTVNSASAKPQIQ